MFKFSASLYLVSFISVLSLQSQALESAPEINLKLNARVQALALGNDSELISERDQNDFLVRRARLKFSGDVDKWIKLVIQTEYAEQAGGSASDAKIIDAYVNLAPNQAYQLYFGQHMAPALRQNISHINAMLTLDRPAMVSKSLTWGTKAKTRFSNLSMNNTNAGLLGSVNVRDIGSTFFGVYSATDKLHYKYYLGLYEGAETANTERITARFQLNLGDAESSYFNAATYFGQRNTIAIGASYDQQSEVARDWQTGEPVNYRLLSVDFFAEKPLGSSSVNMELGWIQLDFDHAAQLTDQLRLSPLSSTEARAAEGQGIYFQSGITLGKWQPWLGWEQWNSEATDDTGSYSNVRLGFTYRLAGDHAKIKLGVERTEADQAFTTNHGSADTLNSIAAGIFLSI